MPLNFKKLTEKTLPYAGLAVLLTTSEIIDGYTLYPTWSISPLTMILWAAVMLAIVVFVYKAFRLCWKSKQYGNLSLRLLMALSLFLPLLYSHQVRKFGFDLKVDACGDLSQLSQWGSSLLPEYDYPSTGKYVPPELWPKQVACLSPEKVSVSGNNQPEKYARVALRLWGGGVAGAEFIIVDTPGHESTVDLETPEETVEILSPGVQLIYLRPD